jgi:hypothetical protein
MRVIPFNPRAIEVLDEESGRPSQLILFSDQCPRPDCVPRGVQVCLDRSAMADLVDKNFSIAANDTLCRCHDLLLGHKRDLFTLLRRRREDLFDVQFDILL